MMAIKKLSKIDIYDRLPNGRWWCIILMCLCFEMVAQQQKKRVEKKDYALWGRLHIQELSTKGNWVSYIMIYHELNDTLYVQNTLNKKTFKIPEGRKSQFIREDWFLYEEPHKKLSILNLKTGQSHSINNIKKWELAQEENHIVMVEHDKEDEQLLVVLNLQNLKSKSWSRPIDYNYNVANQTIAVSQFLNNQNQLVLIKLDTNYSETKIDVSPTENFTELTWQINGENLSYLKGEQIIGLYNTTQNEIAELNLDETSFFSDYHKITTNGSLPMRLSKDGKRVFFGFEPKEVKSIKINPEIWNTYDRWVYQKYKEAEGWINLPKIACWIPEKNQSIVLTDNNLPKGFLNGDQTIMLTFNPMTNEPQFKKDAPVDIYTQSIGQEKKSLVFEKYPYHSFQFHLSPCGKFAIYFHNGHWFSYSFNEEEHRNLTAKINVSFDFESFDMPDSPSSYGMAGWTKDSEALVYDKFDTWLLSGDGTRAKKLTSGRNQETIYRLQKQNSENEDHNFFNRFEKGTYNLTKGLLFTTEKNAIKGFANWTPKKGIKKWGEQTKRLDQLKKAKDANRYVYTEEHFNESPKLIFFEPETKHKKVIMESNQHQKKFEWGFSKQITYTDTKGNILKGALFYPAGYNPSKAYPMVVRIYEVFNYALDRYVIPSDLNTSGFNIANLTTQGFFVLQPNISYEIGNPGISAADCVGAAVDAALKSASIDKNKIGLMGHSFGGYETLFILTQTNRFATAVASAAISDLSAFYLYVDGTINTPNYWRFENHQSRMGKTLFEDKEGYIRNCPISNVEKINTPLLTWFGVEDRLVNPSQSISLYLALRRLKKKNVMLLYEEETHTLKKSENQKDLTNKVENWLKHYLQNEEEQEWMKPQN